MKEDNITINNNSDSEEQNIFAKNFSFSSLSNYGGIIFQLIISFIMARLISPENWGIIIVANSYIAIITVFSYYIPPALDHTLMYYLPKYIKQNKIMKLKYFIKMSLIFKILFLIFFYLIFLISFSFLSNFLPSTLKNNLTLLYILSPLIIINSLNIIFNGIVRVFNLFKVILISLILANIFQISALLYFFFFMDNVSIEYIAIINLISAFIPFIINFIVIIAKLNNIDSGDHEHISFKRLINKIFKYGLPLTLGYLIYGFWDQIQIQGINVFSNTNNVTGYAISIAYSNFTEILLVSRYFPLLNSFSRLKAAKDNKTIIIIYNIMVRYFLFFLLLLSGGLILFSDFFLFYLYGEDYLIFTNFLKLMIIAKVFKILNSPLDAIILASNKGIYISYLRIFSFIIYLISFFIGLLFYGIIGCIYGIIFGNFIIFLIYLISTFKLMEIRLNLRALFSQYIFFFDTLIITAILHNLILNDLNKSILIMLNFSIFEYFHLMTIIVFILIFITQNLVMKNISRKDMSYIKTLFDKDTYFHRLIRNCIGRLE